MDDGKFLVKASIGGKLLLICGLYLLIPGLLLIVLTGPLGLVDSAVGLVFIISGLLMRRATRSFAPGIIAVVFGVFTGLIPHSNTILASFFLPLGGWSPAAIALNFCLNGLVPIVAGILGLVAPIKHSHQNIRITYLTIISSLCFLFSAVCLFGGLIAWIFCVGSGPPKLGGAVHHPYRRYLIPLAVTGGLLLMGGITSHYLKIKQKSTHHD